MKLNLTQLINEQIDFVWFDFEILGWTMNLTHYSLNGLDNGLEQTKFNPTRIHRYPTLMKVDSVGKENHILRGCEFNLYNQCKISLVSNM